MLTKSNSLGFAILSLIIHKLSEAEVANLFVEPYLNGRENGFAVRFVIWGEAYDRKMVFARDRRSDAIAIYEGKSHEFNMLGNGLTEEIYRNSKFFKNDGADEAAKYIVGKLREIKS